MSTRLRDYEYQLPPELIASRPLSERDASRMMVVRRAEKKIEHRSFRELPEFVGPNDLLVLNDTKVLPARHWSDDGKLEFLFLEQLPERRWRALVRPGRKLRVGATSQVQGVVLTVEAINAEGERILVAERETDFLSSGSMPLPPYLGRRSDREDEQRYQTSFAAAPGALAAPTAGLHFTAEMLAGLPHVFVTLHVGTGTFRPVQVEDIRQHQMHAERFSVSKAAADHINAAERVIAVGTTSVRVLESLHRRSGEIVSCQAETDIFIYPPFEFRVVDALLTNFHLPGSTLLMLVSAFAGREFILRAYEEAVRERYRFFSYGDCMLIL